MATDEFREPACVAAFRLILVKKGEFVLVEYPEKFLLGNLFERLFRLAEINPQNSALLRTFDPGWAAIPGFHPITDFVVFRRRLRCAHLSLLFVVTTRSKLASQPLFPPLGILIAIHTTEVADPMLAASIGNKRPPEGFGRINRIEQEFR